jgi:glycosyltransferase involved in cell wall biosynthesis
MMGAMWSRLRGALGRVGKISPPLRPAVYNVNNADARRSGRSALLVYLPEAFLVDRLDPALRRHQNLRRCRQMAAILGEFDYIVDVISKRDWSFRLTDKYALVISERMAWRDADARFRRIPTRVFLATAMNHRLHNENVRRRYRQLTERRNCSVQVRRMYGEGMAAVLASHALVSVGNPVTAGSWSRVYPGPVYAVNTHGLPMSEPATGSKDFERARRHFLFLASRGQVTKGLDLLLEIFPRIPELHLYVCSEFAKEPDFCACYRRELFETPNIHPIGWVSTAGPEFRELARTCAYVIHPSCSEGQAGAVVQGMHAGLIPLVTRECGLDTEDFGVTFADDSLEEIERVIRNVAGRPPDWHREQSARSRAVARIRHSEAAFADRWRDIVRAIVGSRP